MPDGIQSNSLVWEFPTKGKDTNFAYRDQPPGTCADCLNVMAYDPQTFRARGGQRGGTSKLYTSQLGGGNNVQTMAQAAFELQSTGGTVLSQQNISGTFTGSTSQQFSFNIPANLVGWNQEFVYTIANNAIPGGGTATLISSTANQATYWTTTTPTGTGPITGTGTTAILAESAANTALNSYYTGIGLPGAGTVPGNLTRKQVLTPQLVMSDSSVVSLGTELQNTSPLWQLQSGGYNATYVPVTGGGSSWTATVTFVWVQNFPIDLLASPLEYLTNGATTGVGFNWAAATNQITIYSPTNNPAFAPASFPPIALGTVTPSTVQLISYAQLSYLTGPIVLATTAPVLAPSVSLFSTTSTLPATISVNDVFTVTSGTPLHTADPNWATTTNSGAFPQNFGGTTDTSTTNWTGAPAGSGVIINNTAGGVQLPNKAALYTPSLAALGSAYEFQATFQYSKTAGTTDQFMLGFGIDSSNPGTTGWVLVLGLDAATPTGSLYTAAGTLLATANVSGTLFPLNTLITVFVTVTGTGVVVQVGTADVLNVTLALPSTPHYQLGFGYIAAAHSSLTVSNFLAQTLPGQGTRNMVLITIAGGDVYQGDGYSPGQSANVALTTNGTGQFLTTSNPSIAAADGNAYMTDGFNYVVLDLATKTCSPMVATAGTLPPQCPLACIWRGSLVMAGQIGNAQNWYMSAIGDYLNFDYTQTTPTAAIAGNAGTAYGKIGDPILALIPLNDDILLFGATNQFFAFVGDPRYNGVVDHFLQQVGIFGPTAWCFDPVGTLYFFGSGGLYQLPKGGTIPVNLSNRVISSYFQSIDPQVNTINLEWDQDRFGLWICVTPTVSTGTPGVHIFWDQRTGGYFPQQFPDNQGPTAMLFYAGDRPDDRAILLGGRDGYVRRLLASNSALLTDDGTAISSFVILGPNRSVDDVTEGRSIAADFYTGQDVASFASNYSFTYTLQAAPDMFNAAFNPVVTTTGGPVVGQGRIPKDRNARIRGGCIAMKLANAIAGVTWNFERVVLTMQRGAPQR